MSVYHFFRRKHYSHISYKKKQWVGSLWSKVNEVQLTRPGLRNCSAMDIESTTLANYKLISPKVKLSVQLSIGLLNERNVIDLSSIRLNTSPTGNNRFCGYNLRHAMARQTFRTAETNVLISKSHCSHTPSENQRFNLMNKQHCP